MKIHYAIDNLRSLKSTPQIELRPITILVGRNSAGKSTFLRSFALLRQSLEARSSAPILWYGNPIDFGDFSSAVYNGDLESKISFEFAAENFSMRSREPEYAYYYDEYRYASPRRSLKKYPRTILKVSLGEQNKRTVRRAVTLKIPKYDINLDAKFSKDGRSADSFTINGALLHKSASRRVFPYPF